MENRHDKFRRIAQTRLSRVFLSMTLIGNLSNKRYYEFTISEVNEIFSAYRKKGIEIKECFKTSTERKELTKIFDFKTEKTIRNKKNDKFREIAQKRLTKVFTDMNLIANLSNKNNYSYNKEEIEQMFKAYEEKGIATRGYFIVESEFTFSS